MERVLQDKHHFIGILSSTIAGAVGLAELLNTWASLIAVLIGIVGGLFGALNQYHKWKNRS